MTSVKKQGDAAKGIRREEYKKIKEIAGKVEMKISTVKDKNGVMIEYDEKKK